MKSKSIRIFSVIYAVLLCALTAYPVSAEFKNPPVVDNGEVLTEEQTAALSDKLNSIREEYDFDVAIYTEYVMSGYYAEATADDIYDSNGYGGGETDDGIMLYISREPREYHLTTHAKGIEYFNDNGLQYLEEKLLPYLKENDYCSAMNVYADCAGELLQMAANGEPFDEVILDRDSKIFIIIIALTVPLLIAFAAMGLRLLRMKTVQKKVGAGDYVKCGGVALDRSEDIFLYSTVTKTPRPKETQASSSHTSSSGRTHGGRGGSY